MTDNAGGWGKMAQEMKDRPFTLAGVIVMLPLLTLGATAIASRVSSDTKMEGAVSQLTEAVKSLQADSARERERRDATIAGVVANATTITQSVIQLQTQVAILQRDQDRERELNERRQQANSNSMMQLRDLTARALQGTSVRPNNDTTELPTPTPPPTRQAWREQP